MLGAVWPCGLVDIEIQISVRVFYQLQYVLEQFFLGQRLVSGCRLPFGNLQMHIVEVESHCAQDDVHTLLDGMLVRIYLGNIIGADVSSLAKALGVTRQTIYNWREAGYIFLCPVRGWQRAGDGPATAASPFPAGVPPGRYSPPWGGWEGIDQHGELAVVEGAKRAEKLTADRDRFPIISRGRQGRRGCRGNRGNRPW